jgi:Cu(I)-responsive transcriptional regulator
MIAEPALTIGAVARATGTQTETIRYYERIGLLPAPARTAARYRVYYRTDVNRLAFVKRSRDLGFTIEEVRVLLALAQDVGRDCKEVDAIARRHLTDVEGKIGDLQRLAKELRRLIGQCQGGSISECRIVEALAPDISGAVYRDACRAHG